MQQAAPSHSYLPHGESIEEIQRELLRIWRNIFRKPQLGLDDHFFKLGGHSLHALRLAKEVEICFGRSFSMEFLIKSPTIRRLARTLADPSRDRYQYLIPLADKGHRPPLFFAPAGIEYMPMARALGEDQPVIGLSIYRDVHDVQAPNCLEELAADFIEEMLDFQPQGPYFLCGFSLGGIVAFEIARQLVQSGRPVGMVELLDTFPRSIPMVKRIQVFAPILKGTERFIFNPSVPFKRAVHGLDGAVSFILEWNGLTFVYGSDTFPNKWYIEHAKGADIAVHECFLPATLLVTKQGFAPQEALNVGTQGHTSQEQFGNVMSLVEPRLAIGYHFYNDFDTEPEIRERVRKTYSGPLALASDYMVFNVTKDDVRIRTSAIDEEIWPSPPILTKQAPDTGSAINFSDFTKSGALAFPEVTQPIYDEVNGIYGTDFEPVFK